MKDTAPVNEERISSLTINTFIRLGLLLTLIVWCYRIVEPFIIPVAWGVIIAVAISPLYARLQKRFGDRHKWSATIYTLVAILLLITPTLMIAGSLVDTAEDVTVQIRNQGLTIPAPNPQVKEIPLLGEKLYGLWNEVHTNPEAALKTYKPQLRVVGDTLISFAASAGSAVMMFVVSIILSGVFLAFGEQGQAFTKRVFTRLVGPDQGPLFTELAGATIRSVAQGVVGIAIIQAVAAGAGMYVMDVPGWGLWTLLILILAVAQLPPLLVLLPVVLYVFNTADTTPAVLFTIWSGLVSVSDSFLKPLFLGRGMTTPMLVILVGAIGGMINAGIFGLFIGAVLLALAYELFMLWLRGDPPEPAATASH